MEIVIKISEERFRDIQRIAEVFRESEVNDGDSN